MAVETWAQGDETLVPLPDLPTWQELEQHLLTFPDRYRKAFTAKPLEDLSLFVGREEEWKAFERVLERWRNGRAPMAALVGADASGKTTFLNWLEEKVQDSKKIRRLSLKKRVRSESEVIDLIGECFGIRERCNSIEELTKFLAKLPRRIVLVDDAHYLILRAIGAASVIKTFLGILLETRSRFLWVVSFKDHAWRRVDYQFGAASTFTDVIRIPYFREEEMKAALRLRLEASGLTLKDGQVHGSGTEAEQHQVSAKEESEEQTLLDRLSPQIFSLSGGNMCAVLFYWLLSTNYDESKGDATVHPCKGVDLSLLQDLQQIYLFTLAELLAHGGLTPEEHGLIFQRDSLDSGLILDYLVQKRLVEKLLPAGRGKQVIYRADPVFYSPISSALESAHILY